MNISSILILPCAFYCQQVFATGFYKESCPITDSEGNKLVDLEVTLRCLTRGNNKVSCINEDEDNLGPAMVIDKSTCGPLNVKVFYKVCNKAPYEFEVNQPKTKLIFETVRQQGFSGDIIPPHQCKKVKIKKTINTCEKVHAMSLQVTGASLIPFLDGSDIKKIYGYCYLFRRTTMEYASPPLPNIDN